MLTPTAFISTHRSLAQQDKHWPPQISFAISSSSDCLFSSWVSILCHHCVSLPPTPCGIMHMDNGAEGEALKASQGNKGKHKAPFGETAPSLAPSINCLSSIVYCFICCSRPYLHMMDIYLAILSLCSLFLLFLHPKSTQTFTSCSLNRNQLQLELYPTETNLGFIHR